MKFELRGKGSIVEELPRTEYGFYIDGKWRGVAWLTDEEAAEMRELLKGNAADV